MTIEFNRETGEVQYEISSLSRSSQLIAKISLSHLYSVQDRFARESNHRMQQITGIQGI